MTVYPTPPRMTIADLNQVRELSLIKLRSIKPSKEAWAEGMVWYQKANQFCHDLAEVVSLPWDRLGWALAALSPLNHWHRNKIDLVDLITTGDCTALGPTRPKARAILEGADPLEVLGGNKVLSFGDNIVNLNKSIAVTLDSHMARALELPGGFRYLERVGVYEAVAGAVRTSAKNRSIAPHQLQAALWIESRGKAG
jgi:hypothetical protein